MRPRVFLILMLLPLVILGLGMGASAFNHKYVEGFTSTQYRDDLNNTALWDTAAGQMRMAPFEITLAGSYDSPGNALGVAIAGNFAFVADGSDGLRIVDILDPAAPVSAGSYDTPGHANNVAISGNYAFIADSYNGLVSIDISTPGSPMAGSTCSSLGHVFDVCTEGDFAFVADGEAGLAIVDIRYPGTSMSVLRQYSYLETPLGVAQSGTIVYIADNISGLVVLDASPLLGEITHLATYGLTDAYDVAVDGDLVYVACGSTGLAVFDAADPSDPDLLSLFSTPGEARGVAVDGDYVYIADDDSGLVVIDVTDPASPVRTHQLDTPGTASDVAVAGDLAFVADGSYGLAVINIRDNVTPAPWGNSGGNSYDLDIAGDYVYVVASGSGLRVIDVSDPASPVQKDDLATYSVFGVDVEGDYAYIAESGRFRVVDISDPDNIFQTGYFNIGTLYALDVEGNYAYTADAGFGMRVFEISDPYNPYPIGSGLPVPSANLTDIVVDGDRAYMTKSSSPYQLYVIDVSNPVAPATFAIVTLPTYAASLAIDGDYLFVGMHNITYIYDITNPAGPVPRATISYGGTAYDLCVDGDYLYIAVSGTGIVMFDITIPNNPQYLHTYGTGLQTSGVAAAGDFLFTANGTGGMQVLKTFQRFLDRSTDTGRSTLISETADTIRALRLDAETEGSVSFRYSTSAGASTVGITSGSGWQDMIDTWGSGLIWISDHSFSHISIPAVSSLEIEWLYDFASIDAVEDIAGDQGGRARLSWTRSFYDEVGSPVEITGYAVYRMVDSPVSLMPGDGGQIVVDPAGRTVQSYPPGDWDYVMTVPARQEDYYSVVVPTLADSSISGGMNWSTFFISALTGSVYIYYDSYPDSGWSVDNLAPYVPLGLAVAYNSPAGNELAWDEHSDGDFQYFRIYRGDSEDFLPGSGNLVHMTTSTSWSDPVEEGYSRFYKISAVDFSGNESAAAAPAIITGSDNPALPGEFALHQNVPNPFNPVTSIKFDLPDGGEATLEIFDVSGRLVRTLVSAHYPAGRYEEVWNGTSDAGRPVASGIYFYRIKAGRFVDSRKMILLK